MFVHFPYFFPHTLRQVILILNTVLLIAALIVAELIYAESTPEKRKELRYFFPLLIVLVGLLTYAIYLQRKVL